MKPAGACVWWKSSSPSVPPPFSMKMRQCCCGRGLKRKFNYIPAALLIIFISKDVVWSVRVLSVFHGKKGFTVALVHPASYRTQESRKNIFLSLRHVDLFKDDYFKK